MRILLVNQCFYPDVVSTAQHLTDLALELKRRGHEVTVIASSSGYDDPGKRFARREIWNGIMVHRTAGTRFGKGAPWRRVLDFGSFIILCALRLIVTRRVDLVIAMTSPPLIYFFVAVIARIKRWGFVLWIMDLNPDEAVAAGWLREGSAVAKALAAMLVHSLKCAEKIIVLDRFMRQRILDKGIAAEKLCVIPPWSHEEVQRDPSGRERFRAIHRISDKYVVMYSGNHSPCHPLNTLLEAARRVSDDERIAFCFAGGGSELKKVESFVTHHGLRNVLILPYQPRAELSASLSAADLHVVVMGDAFAGIIHPCKIYNVLSVCAPVLYIGPRESHITDIFSEVPGGYSTYTADHDDVEAVVRCLLEGADRELKAGFRSSVSHPFSKHAVVPRLIEALRLGSDLPVRRDCAVADARVHIV